MVKLFFKSVVCVLSVNKYGMIQTCRPVMKYACMLHSLLSHNEVVFVPVLCLFVREA